MDRYFTFINELGQLVIIRQDSMYYLQNNGNVANCTSFINLNGKVTQNRCILNQEEIESLKEITLDEVYHIVAERSK